MRTLLKTIVAGLTGLLALGVTAAFADHKPAYCAKDHDHRSHAANYYDYYPADKYSRAGPYRPSGVSLSIRVGDSRYDHRDRHDQYDRYDRRGRSNGYHSRRGRVVNREFRDTRYRATIVLTEEVVQGRRGSRLVCTVRARGPEARYVSKRRMRHIARENCSRRADIRIYA